MSLLRPAPDRRSDDDRGPDGASPADSGDGREDARPRPARTTRALRARVVGGLDRLPRWARCALLILWRTPQYVLIALISVWRLVVSPLYGPTCKYYPSCSAYGLEAVRRHGAVRGTGLTIWRLLRCNPWSAGGIDDVPLARHPDDTRRPGASPEPRQGAPWE